MRKQTSPFGAWLLKWRKARGLTQQQLAIKANCAQSIISEHERGVKTEATGKFMRPEPELIERLATALDRPVEEARMLAGYNASPAPVTLQEVQQALSASGGVILDPREGQQPVTVISQESARIIAQELAKIFQKTPAENISDK